MATNPIRSPAAMPAAAAPAGVSLASAVDWPAIIAGAVVATAISFILMTFGSAIGLGLTSPYEGSGRSLMFLAIAAGLWVIWVQISSFMAGGYLTGRLRRRLMDATEHESDVRDGCHGLLVWAVGLLIGAMLAASVASGVARTAGSVIAAGAQAVGSTVGGAAQAAAGSDAMNYAVDSLFRSEQAQPGQPGQDNAATAQEAGRILARSAAQGEISGDDKAYLARMIETRTGVDQQQAEQRIDAFMQQVKAAAEKVKVAADRARRIGIIIAFVTAVSLVISAAAAWWAAGMGGRHRDEGTDFAHLIRWR